MDNFWWGNLFAIYLIIGLKIGNEMWKRDDMFENLFDWFICHIILGMMFWPMFLIYHYLLPILEKQIKK